MAIVSTVTLSDDLAGVIDALIHAVQGWVRFTELASSRPLGSKNTASPAALILIEAPAVCYEGQHDVILYYRKL